MYNNIRVLSKGMLRAFDWAATASGTTISVGLASIKPFAYSEIHAYVFGESFSLLYKVLLFVKFQELFLVLNSAYFFPAFFNIGLVFRMIPFTRKLGGLLMGITLGLFFALPYMYILSQIVIQSAEHFSTRFILDTSKWAFMFLNFGNIVDNGGSVSGGQDFEDALDEVRKQQPETNSYGYATIKTLKDPTKQVDFNIGQSGSLPRPGDSMAFGNSGDYYDPANPSNHSYSVVEVVARVILAVTFSSIFSLVGTIAAIREISQLFGGDVEIAGLTRLI
jgi:hypothetical protein